VDGDIHRRCAVVGLVAVVACFLATTKITSSDTWVHLSLGRWIAQRWRVPTRNVLSYTQPNRPTIDHQWLFQLSVYGVERAVGLRGAVAVKAVVVAAAFGVACAGALACGSRPGVALGVGVLCACAARFRFNLRPQVVSFLLLSFYLLAARRWRAGRPWWLLATLPLQVLWANTHGGAAVLGFGVLLVYALGESVSALVARRWGVGTPTTARVGLLWTAAAACVALSMVNPYGAKVLSLPFSHALTQAASGLKELLVDRSRLTLGALSGPHAFFAILAPLVAACVVVDLLRLRFADCLLLLGLLAAAFTSQRFIGIVAIAAAQIVPETATVALERCCGPLMRRMARLGVFSMAALACALAAVAIVAVGTEQPFGLGVAAGRFPEGHLAVLAERFPAARLLNEFEDGGYIHWHTGRPIFVDSRGLLAYSPRFMLDYVATWSSRERFEAVLATYDVEVALVWREPLKSMFRTSGHWRELPPAPSPSPHALFVRHRPPSPSPPARSPAPPDGEPE